MILAIACQCGSSDRIIRNFLQQAGYSDWLNIPIYKGKQKSLSVFPQLPPAPEKEMLAHFLENASKWAVIIGHDGQNMRWSDISHNIAKSRIEAEFLVKTFA